MGTGTGHVSHMYNLGNSNCHRDESKCWQIKVPPVCPHLLENVGKEKWKTVSSFVPSVCILILAWLTTCGCCCQFTTFSRYMRPHWYYEGVKRDVMPDADGYIVNRVPSNIVGI